LNELSLRGDAANTKAEAAHPEGLPWMWTVEHRERKGRPGLHHGNVAILVEAMAAFRESWHRGKVRA
jgi:hypothetical protein